MRGSHAGTNFSFGQTAASPALALGQPATAMTWNSWAPSLLLMLQVFYGTMATFQLPPFLQTLTDGPGPDRADQHSDRVFAIPDVQNVADIRKFTPRKKHLKTQRLLRRMGDHMDPFWMSVDMPGDLLDTTVRRTLDTSLVEQAAALDMTGLFNDSSLWRTFGDFRDTGVNETVLASMFQKWLARKSSCPVYYTWDDLGLLYWPRWVRRGSCSRTSDSASPESCSWPPGMHCVPAKTKRIKILRWQCRNNKAFKSFKRMGRKKRRERKRSKRDADHPTHSQDPRIPNDAADLQPLSEQSLFAALHTGSVSGKAGGPTRQRSAPRPNDGLVSESDGNGRSRPSRPHGEAPSSENETEGWNRKRWRDRTRKLNMKCKWIKVPFPVTDDCYCSC